MSSSPESPPRDPSGPVRAPRLIDAAAKAAFLAALVRGARREDAAEEAGFSLTGFYGARRRDPAFAADWAAALAGPPAHKRRARAYDERGENREGERGEVRIASANRRLLQRRRRRHVRFDAHRQEVYLTHFAADCDSRAAAAAAGVSESTVRLHCRMDREFARAHEDALAQGYDRLEAEILRRRLAAQRRFRAAIEAAGLPARLEDEEAEEFDRVMKLLARHDRRPRRRESVFRPGGRRQRCTFDEAIGELDRILRSMGLSDGMPRRKDE
jgi:hypothetical protein